MTIHNDTYRRNGSVAAESSNQAQTAMTARQLLSILRLSQSLARLRFDTEVKHQDVDEAIRLVYVSKASLTEEYDSSSANQNKNKSIDATSKIYRLLLEYDGHFIKDLSNIEKNTLNSLTIYSRIELIDKHDLDLKDC